LEIQESISSIINEYKIYSFENKVKFVNDLWLSNYKGILVAMNAEKILKSDDKLKEIVNKNLGYTDGVGAVWALRKKGLDACKIPGAELWLEIIKQNYQSKTFYLIGATSNVIESTVNKLKSEYRGIQIIGHRDGYLTESDRQKVLFDLKSLKPDVVFVAMGSPEQEFFMHELLKHHKALYMGLGGSFDVYTGNVERAPVSWINLNLEWAYRLFRQPKRITRQIHLVRFLYLLATNKL
jgi:UDP-N-acetyl-D-mannosaminouronate:lipid I N-acetyl-D-mannosaminouronosyltransferase